ncbi:MAG: type IX secretion system protein PorQ [Bacteroidales bacterium]|nr:type IX secretion system protein PorQ [Bacteroidales bacterium]
MPTTSRQWWKATVPIFVGMAFHFLLCQPRVAGAQVAGMNTLAVLDLTTYGRTAALGLDYLPLFTDDPVAGLSNPSMLRQAMAGSVTASYVPLFRGSNMGSLGYIMHSKRLGTLSLGFHFVNYGRFAAYDEQGTPQGAFAAADYALSVGWGMWLDSNFSFGAQMKPVLSQYESYKALTVAFDVAASYTNTERTLTATLMLRNIGAQLTTFDQKRERLPGELSAEVSYKLKRAPFRLFFALNELSRWRLDYDDPLHPNSTVDPFSGEVTERGWLAATIDNAMRHAQAGVELNLGRSFFARVGYSYRQSAEMRGFDALNISGFSFGLGLRTRRFEVSYARRNYHLSQAPNHITLCYRF